MRLLGLPSYSMGLILEARGSNYFRRLSMMVMPTFFNILNFVGSFPFLHLALLFLARMDGKFNMMKQT